MVNENFFPLFLRIPPQHIVEFKFLLESYEGDLGVLRTLQKETGEVVVLATQDTAAELKSFVKAVRSELEIEYLEARSDEDLIFQDPD